MGCRLFSVWLVAEKQTEGRLAGSLHGSIDCVEGDTQLPITHQQLRPFHMLASYHFPPLTAG